MPGEVQIDRLLKNMDPEINQGEYVFCSVKNLKKINFKDVIAFLKEKEGFTLVIEKNKAVQLGLDFEFISSWITLNVHSSLNAVGFNSIISNSLSKNNISCNVIAGFHHDHLFVSLNNAKRAISILKNLSRNS
ncbi:MAG: acetyltransferase [Flavobacteriaceae bacterium]|nr:acetyltransferase [Flavobacteriaceae bacterium]|tara:strand:+ start:829 stop:1227 length:399 start_codon:yes stop_codon:yes gene_type:complete